MSCLLFSHLYKRNDEWSRNLSLGLPFAEKKASSTKIRVCLQVFYLKLQCHFRHQIWDFSSYRDWRKYFLNHPNWTIFNQITLFYENIFENFITYNFFHFSFNSSHGCYYRVELKTWFQQYSPTYIWVSRYLTFEFKLRLTHVDCGVSLESFL